jgi:hypothetical protein
MPRNPAFNMLDPKWYDFDHGGEAVTFKTVFGREAKAGEKINGETAEAGDLIVTNQGGRSFRLNDEAEKKRWRNTGTERTYREAATGQIVTGTEFAYAGPPVKAVKAGESGFLKAPEAWKGHSGWMMLPDDRIIRDRSIVSGDTFYAMPKAQFEAATEPYVPPQPKAEPGRGPGGR